MTTLLDHYTAKKSCQGCAFAGSDPDGGYCGHKKSLAVSAGFGRSWNACRTDETLCGKAGKWFRRMAKKRATALGIMRPAKDFVLSVS